MTVIWQHWFEYYGLYVGWRTYMGVTIHYIVHSCQWAINIKRLHQQRIPWEDYIYTFVDMFPSVTLGNCTIPKMMGIIMKSMWLSGGCYIIDNASMPRGNGQFQLDKYQSNSGIETRTVFKQHVLWFGLCLIYFFVCDTLFWN